METFETFTNTMLDFNNTEVAFASKSNNDLRNAYILFSTIASPALVKGAKGITNFAMGRLDDALREVVTEFCGKYRVSQ